MTQLPSGYQSLGGCFDILKLDPDNLIVGNQKNASGNDIELQVFDVDSLAKSGTPPKWFHSLPTPHGTKKDKTTTVYSAHDYETIFKSSVEIEGGTELVSAGLGASYDSNYKVSETDETVRVTSRDVMIYDTVSWQTVYPPALGVLFKAKIERLSSMDDCDRFVRENGTHFIQQAKLGTLSTFNQVITRETYERYKETGKGFQAWVNASLAVVKASVKTANEWRDKSNQQRRSSTDDALLQTFGTKTSHVPVSVKLMPIFELLRPKYFGEGLSKVKLAKLRIWLHAAIERYAGAKASETLIGEEKRFVNEALELIRWDWLPRANWVEPRATGSRYNNQESFLHLTTFPNGYFPVGDIPAPYRNGRWCIPSGYVVKSLDTNAKKSPIENATDAEKVWGDHGSNNLIKYGGKPPNPDAAVWKLKAPPGYQAIGYMLEVGSYAKPERYSHYACIRDDLLVDATLGDSSSLFYWDDSHSGAKQDVSFWPIESKLNNGKPTGFNPGVFDVNPDSYQKPGIGPGDTVKLLRMDSVRIWPEGELQCVPPAGSEGPAPAVISITFPERVIEVFRPWKTALSVKDAAGQAVSGKVQFFSPGSLLRGCYLAVDSGYVWKPGRYTVTLTAMQLKVCTPVGGVGTVQTTTGLMPRDFVYSFDVEASPSGWLIACEPEDGTTVATVDEIRIVLSVPLPTSPPIPDKIAAKMVKVTSGKGLIAGTITVEAGGYLMSWKPKSPLPKGSYSVTLQPEPTEASQRSSFTISGPVGG